MTEVVLPPTHMAEKILSMRLPLGQVYVDEVTCGFNADPEPAGVRTVILPLYYAMAYPAHYYEHKLNLDVQPSIDYSPEP